MILIIAAVPMETAILRQEIESPRSLPCEFRSAIEGVLSRQQVLLAHSGIGVINMTLQLTRLLENYSPEAVILCGCGGAYPATGLSAGDLAVATEEILGDTGVATDSGFVPLEQLKIPENGMPAPPFRQRIPLDPRLLAWSREALGNVQHGPFVTINSCSGHPRLSLELQDRTGGICENMEGAAAAQVCLEFNVPLLEIRGISNPTGTRNPEEWNLSAGMTAAQSAVLKLIKNWSGI